MDRIYKVTLNDVTVTEYKGKGKREVKAIAIQGNTKPYKEILKASGAHWNVYLKGGYGWIASIKKKDLIIQRIRKAQEEENK